MNNLNKMVNQFYKKIKVIHKIIVLNNNNKNLKFLKLNKRMLTITITKKMIMIIILKNELNLIIKTNKFIL